MSGIVLSAAVRQNLLSLQSTASLLATTQNDLATGNKINSALDNPTNYFTAQGLNGRASDISNLLDSISNGVQVLQAANTGITSMQSLIDNAKSVATQALQTSSGYDTLSQVTSTAITGAGGAAATANNLLGAGTALSTAVPGTAVAGLGSPSTMLTSLGSAITTGDSLTVNGKTISFVNTGKGNSISAGGATLDLASATVGDLLGAIDTITGTSTASTASGGAITLQTGASSDLTLAGTALAKLGLTTGTTAPTGLTLTVGATGGGTATSITFGTGAGQVSTLNQLNAALAANNLQASLSSTGAIRLSTTNDAASATMGAIGGTAAAAGGAFNGLVAAPPVADPNSQATRANLVAQYNNLIQQLTTTAQDASYNGINLLNGDTLKMTFDETGKSTLSVQGLTLDSTGLGLSKLTAGTDFIDNNSTNSVLSQLNAASTTLRAEASSFGSNLSLVEIRQDFNKNLVNLLQTGASNLTLADTNELAADSQALSTRQSIAVSALGLANQSQQAVLQLLR